MTEDDGSSTLDAPVADQTDTSQDTSTTNQANAADPAPDSTPIVSQPASQDTSNNSGNNNDRTTNSGANDNNANNINNNPSANQPASDQLSPFRSAILDQLKKWNGSVEGSALFSQFMSPATMECQRKAAGKAGIVFTTSIAFQQRVLNDAATAVPNSKVQTNVIGTLAESRARNIPKAWHDGVQGSALRLLKGCIDVDKLVQ